MTHKTALGAAALLALAALAALPAGAQSVSAAEAQLARSLGVAPGAYTFAQLVELKSLRSESGSSARMRIAHLLGSRGEGNSASRAEQFALGLGVAPGQLSVAELQTLGQARRENDSARAGFILSGRSHDAASEATRRQLASSLGVAAGVLSVAELVRLHANRRSDAN